MVDSGLPCPALGHAHARARARAPAGTVQRDQDSQRKKAVDYRLTTHHSPPTSQSHSGWAVVVVGGAELMFIDVLLVSGCSLLAILDLKGKVTGPKSSHHEPAVHLLMVVVG